LRSFVVSFPPEELRKFSEGGRVIAAAMGTSVELWARAEAGSILKRWAGLTKVATAKQLGRSAILRTYRDARRDVGFDNPRKGSTSVGQASINLGFRSGPFGKVYYRTRKAGAAGGRRGLQDVYGPNFGSGKHIADRDFGKVERMKNFFQGAYKGMVKAAKQSAGLSRQSVIQIADQLGIDLGRVPGMGVSAAGIAKARTAVASNGRHYQNGYGVVSDGAKEFYLTLINRYPKGGKVGMDRTLATVIRGRLKYFRRNLEEGTFLSAERAAKAYPYLKVLKNAA
jgi:hypothetical protein